MDRRKGIVRGIMLATLLVVVIATAGYSATATGSQTVTITAANAIEISVPATATIASTAPGACGTTSSTINVKSNKTWNMAIRSAPATYPNGKAKNGSTELTNVFAYQGGDVTPYANITSIYANLFTVAQVKTGATGTNVAVSYQQCVDWLDSAGDYTIVVDYQASN